MSHKVKLPLYACLLLTVFLFTPSVGIGADPQEWTKQHLPELVELYRELHAHPELSFQEEKTAQRLAEKKPGYYGAENRHQGHQQYGAARADHHKGLKEESITQGQSDYARQAQPKPAIGADPNRPPLPQDQEVSEG